MTEIETIKVEWFDQIRTESIVYVVNSQLHCDSISGNNIEMV